MVAINYWNEYKNKMPVAWCHKCENRFLITEENKNIPCIYCNAKWEETTGVCPSELENCDCKQCMQIKKEGGFLTGPSI